MFEVKNLKKVYVGMERDLPVLNGVNFQCREGEFVGIFGVSGAGKSTFLHILGGLDEPSFGSILFDGDDIFEKGSRFLAKFRNRTVGFVFQFYHLLPEFSAVENVMLPCLIKGLSKKESRILAEEALELVEMGHRGTHKPSQLSGGEQQRVSVARAIVMKPRFILADEPTGNLDEANGLKIFSVLSELHKKTSTGIIMVTHNPDLLKRIPRRLELSGGVLNESN